MITRRTALGLIAASIASPALAGRSEIFKDSNNVAVNGYDVVGYFTEGQPVQGDAAFSTEWMGAIWQFANGENRAAFVADPSAFAPQYGGYCAYAASKGALASTVPEAWTIADGRLYLNYNLYVRELWRLDIPGYIEKADQNWPGLHLA